jgi:hypothetical protein
MGIIQFLKTEKNENGEENCQGGGVAMLIKDNLIFKEHNFNNGLETLEMVGAEVSMGNKNIMKNKNR